MANFGVSFVRRAPTGVVDDFYGNGLQAKTGLKVPVRFLLPTNDPPGSIVFDASPGEGTPKFYRPADGSDPPEWKSFVGDGTVVVQQSLVSMGSGASVVAGGTAPIFQTKALIAGSGVGLSLDVDGSVLITGTSPSAFTLVSVGGSGETLVLSNSPATVKSIVGLDGISVVPSADALTISHSGPPLTTATLTDVATTVPSGQPTPVSAIISGAGPGFTIRRITTSGGLEMTVGANTIEFEIPTPAYSLMTFSDAPGGVGVSFLPDAGDSWPTFQLKSLVAGSSRVVITSTPTTVTIGSAIQWSSVGLPNTIPLLSPISNTNDFVLQSANASERIAVNTTSTNVGISIPVPAVFRTTFTGDRRLQLKYTLNSIPTLSGTVTQDISYSAPLLSCVLRGDVELFSLNFELPTTDTIIRLGIPDRFTNTPTAGSLDVQPIPSVQFWRINPTTHAPELNSFPCNPGSNGAPQFSIASIQPDYMDFFIDQILGTWRVCLRF